MGGKSCSADLRWRVIYSYSWWNKDENKRDTAQNLFVSTEFVSKIRKPFIATSDVQSRRWQEEDGVRDKFVFFSGGSKPINVSVYRLPI